MSSPSMIDTIIFYVFTIVVALMFFGPSSIALLLLYRKKRRQKVAQPNELSKAIACHTFGALLSPGLPIAYFAFVSATCGGGGCGSGVWIILLMPVVWPLWWVGWRASERAFETEK